MPNLPEGIDFFVFCGAMSGAFATLAFLLYIRDTLTGRTEPQRASWLIWSVLGVISLMSQTQEGATASLLFQQVRAGGSVFIFVLAAWIGSGKVMTPGNLKVLSAAALGLVIWACTDTSAYALAIIICVGVLGGTATVYKVYCAPRSETLSMWILSMIASGFALIAVGSWNWVLLAYPLYLCSLFTAITTAILVARWRNPSPAMKNALVQ